MRLALLHRRLSVLMALAALTAFSAGSGMQPLMWVAAGVLGFALLWHPSARAGVWVERLGWAGSLALFAWILYVALVLAGDYLPPILGFLLFLLAAESLRPLDARNDLRLYALSFALLIAATAYYPGFVFAGAFIAYIALATLALMVGHLRRQTERFGVADIRLRRSFLVATATLSGVIVLMSAVVFVTFPRLPRGWIAGARAAAQTTMVGFGEGVSLGEHGGRIYSNPEVAFRVEFAGSPPAELANLHWRGRSYDHFDGVRWSRSRDLPPSSPPPHLYRDRWKAGPERHYQIYGGPAGVRVLFGLHPIVEISPRTGMRRWLEPSGDIAFSGGDAPVYAVRSAAASPGERALRQPIVGDLPGSSYYLQLPPLSPRIWQLADSLTRGEPTRYDAARGVERWLRSEFGYTLDLPARPEETSLEHFLFERRQGHCEYFSSAMAVLLRAIGIPARNVTGFLGGEWQASGEYLVVTQNDAHSWVEVWFPGLGWMPFDPTPAASRNQVAGSGANPSWRWPLQLWVDGLQHRWFKWVLYYDLDKQITVFRRVSDVFSRNPVAAREGSWGGSLRQALPWIAGVAGLVGIGWFLRPGRPQRRRRSPETRAYLRLRRAYVKAGYDLAEAAAPLQLLELLASLQAPARAEAEEVVTLYLRARFGGERIGEAGRARMDASLAEVKRALRRRGRLAGSPRN